MTEKAFHLSVQFWSQWASERGDSRYDFALFKIWIQFERFLSDLFVSYSLGRGSEYSYNPALKISFLDETQLNAFLRERGKEYINYLPEIRRLSKHIFVDDPFGRIFENPENKEIFNQIESIRNYIAHESGDSRTKYQNLCHIGKEFIEPNDYLKSINKSEGCSYYSYYVKSLSSMASILVVDIDW